MSDWREQKRKARRDVHDTMALDAQYYPQAGATPVPVRVRLHYRFDAFGDDRSMGWAEQQVVKPRLVFMLDELTPEVTLEHGAIVYIAPGEAYEIDNAQPADDITVTVEATRMPRRQLENAGLPVGVLP